MACPSYKERAKPILVTTSTCPNCKVAKRLLSQAGIDYDVIVADQGDQQFAKEHHIQMAPTLLIEEKDGLHQFENVSEISGYLQSKGK